MIPRYEIVTHPIDASEYKGSGSDTYCFSTEKPNSYQNVEYMMLVSYQSQPLASFLKQMNQNQEEYIQAYIEDGSGEIILHTQGDEYMGDFFRRLSGRKCINGSDRTNCKL